MLYICGLGWPGLEEEVLEEPDFFMEISGMGYRLWPLPGIFWAGGYWTFSSGFGWAKPLP
jgi:hypothetical protein